MKPPRSSTCSASAAALEHALLGLDGAEARAFESHAADCEACAAVQDHLARALAEVLEGLEPVAPGRDVWSRIEERIEDDAASRASAAPAGDVQPWKRWAARSAETGGFAVHRADPDAWEPTSIPGIEVQPLTVQPELRQATMLVRMAPGTAYPPHRHGGPEECFVLSGDLSVGTETELRTGDFQRAEAGSLHPVQSTRGGCLLLIQTSLDDQLIG
ncbi:MAG: cupin domain-containing protein [Planctomycetaceae bacterium]|nr:cupin domain-containing protein [Planctomycetaceae bacterium]